VDFYSVTVPQSAGAAPYLIASARAIDSAVLYPTINVFDQSGNPQSVNIVVEDAGDIVAQVANVIPGATYYVEVAAAGNAGSHNTGAYVLGVNFRSAGLVLPLMASDTLSSSTSGLVQDVFTMNVSQSQLVTYTLSASAPGATAPEAVRMRIYDQYGNVMFTLDALNGQTVSGSAFLPLGKYTVVFTAATQDGSPLAPFTYRLRGKAVTDPLCPVPISPTGPAPDDPTLTTGGTAPSDPSASPWTPAS
jgi:hypothetical protein